MELVWSIKNGRLTRCLAGLVAIAVGAMLVGACSSSSSSDSNAGQVSLSPASGSAEGTPTWSTTAACPAGYEGSAVFRAVRPDGTTYSISPVNNIVTAPFRGTLLASIAEIASLLPHISNGTKQKYVIVCFSGGGLTGQEHQEMSMFVTYAHNQYTSGSTG